VPVPSSGSSRRLGRPIPTWDAGRPSCAVASPSSDIRSIPCSSSCRWPCSPWRSWPAIPRDTRPRRLGAWHGIGNLVIVLLFAGSWALRFGEPAYGPDILPFILGAIGVLLALGTAWLGGELVYRHGIGVDPLPGDDPALADGRRRPADDRAGRPA
jgi:hypothetical protein